MSLFEKLNNKRYNLQEVTKKLSPNSDGKVVPNSNTKSAKEITKKYNKLNPNRPEFDSSLSPSQRNFKNIQQNKGKIGKMVVNPSSAQKARGLTPGDIDFKDAESLYAKRKARINPKTGKATRKGVEDFIFSRTGGNRPGQTHLSPSKIKELKRVAQNQARIPSVYKEISDKINKSDYAGKRTRQRPSNAPSYAEIKKKIDAKNPTYIGKSGKPLPVAGKQSIVTPAGKLKTSPLDAGKKALFGDVVRPGYSSTYKPYYPKTTRGKIYKFLKKNIGKGLEKGYKLAKKHPKTRNILGLGALAYTGYKVFAPKPKKKYEPITPVDLRLNLNRSKRDMVPNPKYNPKDPNSKKEVSRQKFDIDNRNIYTGKLLKPSSVDKSQLKVTLVQWQRK